MKANIIVTGLALAALLAGRNALAAEEYALRSVQVAVASDAPALTLRAADEVRRYVYLLTGAWCPKASNAAGVGRIVIRIGADAHVPGDGPDSSQNFALYEENGNQVVVGR